MLRFCRLGRFLPAPLLLAAVAAADTLSIHPPIDLVPPTGVPIDLHAAGLDGAAAGPFLWIVWSVEDAPTGGVPRVEAARMALDDPRPVHGVVAVTGAAFTTVREVRLSPSSDGNVLLLVRGTSDETGPALWRSILSGSGPPEAAPLERMERLPPDLLEWDVTPWQDVHLIVWTRRTPGEALQTWTAKLSAQGVPGEGRRVMESPSVLGLRAAAGPSGGFLVWRSGPGAIHGIPLDAEGGSAGASSLLWEAPAGARVRYVKLVPLDGAYLAAWVLEEVGTGLLTSRAGRIGPGGDVVDPSGLAAGVHLVADVAVSAHGEEAFLAWWDAGGRFLGRRLEAGLGSPLTFLDEVPVRLVDPPRSRRQTSAPQTWTSFYKGWFWAAGILSDPPLPWPESTGEIWLQRIGAGGDLHWPGGTPLAVTPDPGDPTVLWDGRGFLSFLPLEDGRGFAYAPFSLAPGVAEPDPLPLIPATSRPGDPHAEVAAGTGAVQFRIRRAGTPCPELVGLDGGMAIVSSVELCAGDGSLPESQPRLLRLADGFLAVHDGGGSLHLHVTDDALHLLESWILGERPWEASRPVIVLTGEVSPLFTGDASPLSGGDQSLLFWRETDGEEARVRVRRLLKGWPVGEPETAVADRVPEAGTLAAAWSGSSGLLVWHGEDPFGGPRVKGIIFDAGGRALSEPFDVSGPLESTGDLHCVWDGRFYLVLFGPEQGETEGLRIGRDGSAGDGEPWGIAGSRVVGAASSRWPLTILAQGNGRLRFIEEPQGPPEPFALHAPADGDTVWHRTPVFSWTASRDLDYGDEVMYRLAIEQSGGPFFESTPQGDTTLTLRVPLERGAEYEWRVAAVDTRGNETPASGGPRRFTVSPEDEPPFLERFAGAFDPEASSVELSWRQESDPDVEDVFVERWVDGARVRFPPLPPCGDCRFVDSDPPVWRRIAYRLVARLPQDVEEILAEVEVSTASSTGTTRLLPAFPCPGSGPFRFRYELAGAGSADLAVYDAAGRRIRTVLRGGQPAGTGEVSWDGRNDAGAPAAQGVYGLRLQSRGVTLVRRIVLLRGP
jgi:hypothetical protein